MDIRHIKALWPPSSHNKNAAIARWDNSAPAFGRKPLPTTKNSAVMALINHMHMLTHDGDVLDVGCGAGRFSLALARQCRHVTGTDMSPGMIDEARQHTQKKHIQNVDFVIYDWNELYLDEMGWHSHFDFVLANMTPAIDSPEALEKLSGASRGWCLLCSPVYRTDSVMDALLTQLTLDENGRVAENQRRRDTLTLSFALLLENGYAPYVTYDSRAWDDNKPLDQATHDYTQRIRVRHNLTDAHEQTISTLLLSIAKNGRVLSHIKTTAAIMYWHV